MMEEPVLIQDTYSLATPLHLVQKKYYYKNIQQKINLTIITNMILYNKKNEGKKVRGKEREVVGKLSKQQGLHRYTSKQVLTCVTLYPC